MDSNATAVAITAIICFTIAIVVWICAVHGYRPL
jgi:hypothetical protein